MKRKPYSYRKCPTCGGLFGRGAGANGLARHDCDHPLVVELRKRIALAIKHLRGEVAYPKAGPYRRIDCAIAMLNEENPLRH